MRRGGEASRAPGAQIERPEHFLFGCEITDGRPSSCVVRSTRNPSFLRPRGQIQLCTISTTHHLISTLMLMQIAQGWHGDCWIKLAFLHLTLQQQRPAPIIRWLEVNDTDGPTPSRFCTQRYAVAPSATSYSHLLDPSSPKDHHIPKSSRPCAPCSHLHQSSRRCSSAGG